MRRSVEEIVIECLGIGHLGEIRGVLLRGLFEIGGVLNVWYRAEDGTNKPPLRIDIEYDENVLGEMRRCDDFLEYTMKGYDSFMTATADDFNNDDKEGPKLVERIRKVVDSYRDYEKKKYVGRVIVVPWLKIRQTKYAPTTASVKTAQEKEDTSNFTYEPDAALVWTLYTEDDRSVIARTFPALQQSIDRYRKSCITKEGYIEPTKNWSSFSLIIDAEEHPQDLEKYLAREMRVKFNGVLWGFAQAYNCQNRTLGEIYPYGEIDDKYRNIMCSIHEIDPRKFSLRAVATEFLEAYFTYDTCLKNLEKLFESSRSSANADELLGLKTKLETDRSIYDKVKDDFLDEILSEEEIK